MKICPVCKQQFPTKAALAAHAVSHSGRVGSRRRRNRGTGGNTVLALKEYWGTAARTNVSTIDMKPNSSKLTKLSAMAAIYETYKLLQWTVHIVHTGGANTSGSYFAGVSLKADKHPTDAAGIAALAPSICKSATSDASISAPCAKAMGQAWLDNDGTSPGAVLIYNSTGTDLNVFVSYKVQFAGPTAISQSSETYFTTDGNAWFGQDNLPVTTAEIDYDVYGELEYQGTEAEGVTLWTRLTKAWSTAREMHRVYQASIGLIHFLASSGAVQLPQLGRPAILHLQQRPFRAGAQLWGELSGSGAQNCRTDEPASTSRGSQ